MTITAGRHLRRIAERGLTSVANKTKWDELRAAMLPMDNPPRFRLQGLDGTTNPYPDSEWHWHFRVDLGGYDQILHVDLLCRDTEQQSEVRTVLRQIGLVGYEIDQGFRVFGYQAPGEDLGRF